MRLQFVLIAVFLLLASLASAQDAPAAQPAPAGSAPAADVPPPPPPAAPPPAPADAPPPAPDSAPAPAPAEAAPGAECVPACRSGYLCQQGVCISACNPPCAAGQQCTAGGECVADTSVPAPTFFAPPKAPPPEQPEPGAEAHDGFMLRFTLGFGGSRATQSGTFLGNDYDDVYSGFSTSLSADVGGSIIENLVLHGRFAYFGMADPELSVDGDDLGTAEDFTVGAILLAPAVTYYFMPINLYVTGAVGFSWIGITDNRDEESRATDTGLGLNVDVGKEWWVADNWGFGVAGRFWYSRIAQGDEGSLLVVPELDYTYTAFAVLFTATYQ